MLYLEEMWESSPQISPAPSGFVATSWAQKITTQALGREIRPTLKQAPPTLKITPEFRPPSRKFPADSWKKIPRESSLSNTTNLVSASPRKHAEAEPVKDKLPTAIILLSTQLRKSLLGWHSKFTGDTLSSPKESCNYPVGNRAIRPIFPLKNTEGEREGLNTFCPHRLANELAGLTSFWFRTAGF